MKSILLIVLFIALAQAQRLIKVSEGSATWMTENEVFDLIRNEIAFMDVTDNQDLDKGAVPKVAFAFPTKPTHQEEVEQYIAKIEPDRFKDDLTYLSQQFFTRYYKSTTGTQSANWLFEKAKEYSANRTDITISQFLHTAWEQRSLIARIKGVEEGPLVIIGAHQDSINSANPTTGRSPGADDDGSGSITILEMFRVLAENDFKPHYPLEFQWYAAEEVGLLGSQAIAQSYKNNEQEVFAMFQLDMTAYTETGLAVRVIRDFVDSELTNFVETVITEYTSLTMRNYTCGYACSDHASYNRAGYASSSVFEPKTNIRIHQAGDDLDLVNWEQTTEFIKLGLGVAIELSQYEA